MSKDTLHRRSSVVYHTFGETRMPQRREALLVTSPYVHRLTIGSSLTVSAASEGWPISSGKNLIHVAPAVARRKFSACAGQSARFGSNLIHVADG